MFKKKFDVKKIHLPNQNGNYRETLRENDNALKKLGWKPKGDLSKYINEL